MLAQFIDPIDLVWSALPAAAAVIVLLMLAVVVWMLLRCRPRPPEPGTLDLSIDVSSLPMTGPPAEGPRLEFYGTPVRLAAVVIAPVGRVGTIPSREQIPNVLEQLLPSLLAVVSSHQPVMRLWPSQLSSQGFTNAFFNKASLPGDRGKGTPWCSAAGKFTAFGKQYLAGLVCCSDQANGLSQLVIEHEGQWNDVLRVRD